MTEMPDNILHLPEYQVLVVGTGNRASLPQRQTSATSGCTNWLSGCLKTNEKIKMKKEKQSTFQSRISTLS